MHGNIPKLPRSRFFPHFYPKIQIKFHEKNFSAAKLTHCAQHTLNLLLQVFDKMGDGPYATEKSFCESLFNNTEAEREIKSLVDSCIECDTKTVATNVKTYLEKQRIKLKVTKGLFNELQSEIEDAKALENLIEIDNEATYECMRILSFVAHPEFPVDDASNIVFSSEEDSTFLTAQFLPLVILNTLKFLTVEPLSIAMNKSAMRSDNSRNSHPSTSVGQTRPDIKIEIFKPAPDGRPSPIIVFRCELKGASKDAESLQKAKEQLEDVSRTVWDSSLSGDAPFLFALIGKGLDARLLVMRWKDSSYLKVTTEEIMSFNLATALGRLQAIRTGIFVAQITRVLMNLLPKIVPSPSVQGGKSVLAGKENVGFVHEKGRITKQISMQEMVLIAHSDVKSMYDVLASLENGVKLVEYNEDLQYIETKPIGHPRLPSTPGDFLQLFKDAKEQLNVLHDKGEGFVHRDVRMYNFVRLPNGHWMLIDLECGCGKHDGQFSWPSEQLLKDEHKPMFVEDKSEWKIEYDFHQLGVSSIHRLQELKTEIPGGFQDDTLWSDVKNQIENFLLQEDKVSLEKLTNLIPPT